MMIGDPYLSKSWLKCCPDTDAYGSLWSTKKEVTFHKSDKKETI